jgi:hypothetical protein
MASDHQNADGQRRDAATALSALAEPGEPLTSPCPTMEEIAAWHDGALADDDASRVKAHVARCDTCFDLWSGMLEALGEPAATSNVVSLKPAPWRRPLLALAASFLCIALLLPVLTNRAPADLPAYQLQVSQSATLRGDEPAPTARVITLAPGDRFEMLFLPASEVAGKIEATALVERNDRWEALVAPPVIDQSLGVLEITGTVGTTVTFPQARNELIVAVGRAGQLPDAATLVQALSSEFTTSTPTWTAWRFTVVITQGDE